MTIRFSRIPKTPKPSTRGSQPRSGISAAKGSGGNRTKSAPTYNEPYKHHAASPEPAPLPPAPMVLRLTIDENNDGQRIDNFLASQLKGVPKSHIFRVIRSGEVRLNSKRAEPSTKIATGDIVRVPPIKIVFDDRKAQATARDADKLTILYEDNEFLAVNKPSGTAVHGGSGIAFGVVESLRAARPDAKFIELVHRLDRDTSGVLLLAKKRTALLAMHAQLRAKSENLHTQDFDPNLEGDSENSDNMRKRYTALVQGVVRDKMRRINISLVKFSTADGERRVRVAKPADAAYAQAAQSIVHLKATFPEVNKSLVEVEILTGRTHQIRVHMAAIGHPVVGDDKYGDFADNRASATDVKRMFLHAHSLEFTHPVTGQLLVISAPLERKLNDYLNKLNLHSGVKNSTVE